MAGPLIEAVAGGLPERTRSLSTSMALPPPPPTTAKSFQVCPRTPMSAFSSSMDFASPGDVQKCRTSTSPARAGRDTAALADARTMNTSAESFMACLLCLTHLDHAPLFSARRRLPACALQPPDFPQLLEPGLDLEAEAGAALLAV